jgi:dTDP-4-amino-4,6-dideoxygalactose transaminase
MKISFNKPCLAGSELDYIKNAVERGKISGNGYYTVKCHDFFKKTYGFKKCLLTTSCTDALEMAAILCNIQPGDEVIAPSYTFVSTANAFVLRGAKIVFADSRADYPGIDENQIEELITDRTRVIVPVHYAGVACNMNKIMQIANKHKLFVVEDAAQAIDSYYKKQPLGGIGHLGCFSFHETKNIQCGEGGMLVINDSDFFKRSEIIWEKGTNRAEFFRGEISKYGWVDIGSSYLPSDVTAAFLLAQLENLNSIQTRRKEIWQQYYQGLGELQNDGFIKLPVLPDYATNNAYMFYFLCENTLTRDNLLSFLNGNGIHAVFHYLPLHSSEFYSDKYKGKELNNCNFYSSSIIRLPLYSELSDMQISLIIDTIYKYYNR